MANAILPLPINDKDPIWITSAQMLLTAEILYYFTLGVDFIDTIMNIMTTPPAKIIKEIIKSDNALAKMYLNSFVGIDLADSKFLMGINQEIMNRISIFASDTTVRNALIPSKNQIDWQKDTEDCAIFISVPEDRLEQYTPVLVMMFTQAIRTFERRPEKHSCEYKNREPVLLMFDEFPRLGKMEVITTAVSTLRSKGVTICLAIQSIAQMDAIYGQEVRRVILDNCAYQVILKITDADSQKYFSHLIGTHEVSKTNNSTNYDVNWKPTGYSSQTYTECEPIIRPNEFAGLKDIVVSSPEYISGYCRVKKNPYYPTESRFDRFCNKVSAIAGKIWSNISNFFRGRRTQLA